MSSVQQKKNKNFFNSISTADVLIVLSIPVLLVIGGLIMTMAFRFISNYAWVIIGIYCILAIAIVGVSSWKLYHVERYLGNIDLKKQIRINYSNELPKGKVDYFFYRIFEILNDRSATVDDESATGKEEKGVNISVYHTGKVGGFMALNFFLRIGIFVAFAIIYFINMENIKNNNEFFVLFITIFCISLLELMANAVNTFLYWRTVYASGKDRLIAQEDLEQRLKSLEEEIDIIKKNTSV
ncbi:hypothetical protein CN993_00730 [Bacillus thuringiensis]|uniref:hypothetical protein n=1 Tax=Bacillus thuringiensis TaxID=1428 RepID=UPI000BFCF841|nr:hypothetical protein [Bacillus thuringiensis]PGP49028.1 hypothetical protein CN993_00730 [Bacillus thuringiensis]